MTRDIYSIVLPAGMNADQRALQWEQCRRGWNASKVRYMMQ